MIRALTAAFLVVGLCNCQVGKRKVKTPSELYIEKEQKIIKAHALILQDEGRMPLGFWQEYTVLGRYGWHTNTEAASVGPRPPLWLLQEGSRTGGGSFGAYSYYQPAFEQARRSWWIDGVMETGSDLLWPMNINAKFDKSIIGYKVNFIYQGGDGPDIRGATVIDLPTYPDGSPTGALRLDKKSRRLARQWGIAILPPDFVDMCDCTMK